MPIANLYFTGQFLTANSQFAPTKTAQTNDDAIIGLVVVYTIIFSSIAAVNQSGKPLPGLPNARVFKSAVVRRVVWMPIANLYFTAKAITSISHFANNIMYQRENNTYMGLGIAVVLCCVTIAAVIQSGKPLPGLPNTRVFKSAVVRRVVKFHIWSQFNVFLAGCWLKATMLSSLWEQTPSCMVQHCWPLSLQPSSSSS